MNNQFKEGLYTDVQIFSPQNGFYAHYPPVRYGYFDTRNRKKCCLMRNGRNYNWLNEGFKSDNPFIQPWVYIGYIEKPFRIDHNRFPLKARKIVPGRLYEYKVVGPYGNCHGVKQTRKISNGDTIEVYTLQGGTSTWRAKLVSNKWPDLL